MYDLLTRDQLHTLHSAICAEHTANHAKLMDRSLSIWSGEYAALDVRQAELSAEADDVYAEIQRRDMADADIAQQIKTGELAVMNRHADA